MSFDQDELSCDGGLLLLMQDPSVQGAIRSMANCLKDPRARCQHSLEEMIAQRVYQILAGYEDGNDCDTLRHEAIFKLATGRRADGAALASQPTISRLENLPSIKELLRIFYAQIDLFVSSYTNAPAAIVIDVDPTASLTYGQQQLQLFNAHVGAHCLMPFHVYEGQSGRPIATILRPGKVPSATEIKALMKRLVKRLRSHWPEVHIILRADSHHTKPAVMDWCEQQHLDYITGLEPNARLKQQFAHAASQAKQRYQYYVQNAEPERTACIYASGFYAAGSWSAARRVVCRVYHGPLGSDMRFLVTTFTKATARYLYDTVYCGRGNAELMIKEHKLGLKSDRMSCTSACANQFRLYLHNLAYLILHRFRARFLKGTALAKATFTRIRFELLKTAARLTVRKTYVHVHLSRDHPHQRLWQGLSRSFQVIRAAEG